MQGLPGQIPGVFRSLPKTGISGFPCRPRPHKGKPAPGIGTSELHLGRNQKEQTGQKISPKNKEEIPCST
nr:MAG TPA: hypothetical protein [Caudoviricetes sp.]